MVRVNMSQEQNVQEIQGLRNALARSTAQLLIERLYRELADKRSAPFTRQRLDLVVEEVTGPQE